ncbi:venom acid phosphatase Acph-1-like [Copidosoma floridanum]|uniref:venom acid phosphatase Acph-1-like n=1 Tax=Copidosoma floridanum TaxID=29053 RepID=UPI000C6F8DB0|nr:venom acid phosphatase Acph-1-like [Copidosoma floridanum]
MNYGGKKQEYKLGILLRKYYGNHIGTFNEKELVAKSTNSVRTIESLRLVLTGLFAPNLVPDRVASIEKNMILAPYLTKKFKDFHKNVLKNSKEFQKKLSNYTTFIKFLEEKTGQPYFPDAVLKLLYKKVTLKLGFQLFLQKSLNIPLPSWCTDEVYEESQAMKSLFLKSLSLNMQLKKLNGGGLIRTVIENMEQNTRRRKKIYLYGGHDISLISFSASENIIGAFEEPPLGSAYIVESYKDMKQKYYMRVLSSNGSSDELVELIIKNCERYCLVDKYKMLVKNIIPTDEDLKFFNPGTTGS